MGHIEYARRSLVTLLTLALVAVGTVSAAAAQGVDGTTTMISIDSPSPDQRLQNGQIITIGGWAADVASPGGVGTVEVYLDGKRDEGGRLLGKATYGKPRRDVALSLGDSSFTNVGFDYVWTVSAVPGGHTAYVYVLTQYGWQHASVTFTVGAPGASTSQSWAGNVPGGQYPAGGYGQGSTTYGQSNPTGQGILYQGNPVNVGGTGSTATSGGQSYGSTSLPTYGTNPYGPGAGTASGYQTQPMINPGNYPSSTAGYSTYCPCAAGNQYAGAYQSQAGSAYGVTNPYAGANPYGVSGSYGAANPYVTGTAYQSAYQYPTASTYGYGSGYTNPYAYGAAASATTGALGSPYGYSNPYPAPYGGGSTYPTTNPYGNTYGGSYGSAYGAGAGYPTYQGYYGY